MDGEPKKSHLGQVAGWHVRGSGGKLTGTGVVAGLVGRGEEEGGSRVHHGASRNRSRRWSRLARRRAGREAGRKANDYGDV